MKKFFKSVLKPIAFPNYGAEVLMFIPRVLAGLVLSLEYGSSKFGVPWSESEEPLRFFEVAAWFPEDIEKFGFVFGLAPHAFAWLAAFTETIGALFFSLGLFTRFWSFMLAVTMLTAIIFQKLPKALEWGSSWPLLPAAGFLWLSLIGLIFGGGRLSLDYLTFRKR